MSIDKLPEWANAVRWGILLNTHPSTIARAERQGKLETGTYINKRVKLFSKKQILAWLQIPYEEPKPKTKRQLVLSKKG